MASNNSINPKIMHTLVHEQRDIDSMLDTDPINLLSLEAVSNSQIETALLSQVLVLTPNQTKERKGEERNYNSSSTNISFDRRQTHTILQIKCSK